jgi:hypothetical protein
MSTLISDTSSDEEDPEQPPIIASAVDVLDRIRLTTKPSKRLIAKKCRLLAKIFKVGLDSYDAESMALHLFHRTRIFRQKLRIAEQKDTGKVVFFSDVYHPGGRMMAEFVKTCRVGGLDVETFDIPYKRSDDIKGVAAPQGSVITTDYLQMCRGRLVGIVL